MESGVLVGGPILSGCLVLHLPPEVQKPHEEHDLKIRSMVARLLKSEFSLPTVPNIETFIIHYASAKAD